jgi:hypothetical protein
LVVGYCESRNDLQQAFLYTPGKGMKAIGGKPSTAFSINDAGQIVGGGRHAFLFDKDIGMRVLDGPGCPWSMPVDINNSATAVGYVVGGHSSRAVVYRDGKVIDLNRLIDPDARWTLLGASAINDSGQIVGHGMAPNGNTRAFLLTAIEKEARGGKGEGRDKSQIPSPKSTNP